MFVKDRMTQPVIVAPASMSIHDALFLMRKEHIRRLPVVDKKSKLVGIVSERDLLHASPSAATSLSIWELTYLINTVKIESIMTKQVITVVEDTPIEEAAQIMADQKIGGLPVVRDGDVVGIITETNLFRIFLELLGARDLGIRVSALLSNQPGKLANLAKAVFDAGGNIVSMGTFLGDSTENIEVVLKVSDIDASELQEVLEPVVERLLDIREPSLA